VRSTSRSTSAYRSASNFSGTPWVARALRLVLWTQPRSGTRRFMESHNLQEWTRIGSHEPLQRERAPQQRAADVSSAEPSFFCRQDAGSTLRFMESFLSLLRMHRGYELIFRGRERLRRALIFRCVFRRNDQGSTESLPTFQVHGEPNCNVPVRATLRFVWRSYPSSINPHTGTHSHSKAPGRNPLGPGFAGQPFCLGTTSDLFFRPSRCFPQVVAPR